MFFVSAVFIILSSYFILSLLQREKKERNTSILYFLLTAFAQIVLSMEILSLFNSISQKGMIICNTAVLFISAFLLIFKKIKLYKPNFDFKNIKLALKRDKSLIFLSICFIIFLIFQLITIFVYPVKFADALIYYLPRCTSWIQNGSISHIFTPDTRELVMPVNMDFLYTWVLLFRKSITGIAIFSFLGFLTAVYVIYNLLREFNFSTRRSLWTIFVFSSFALVISEMISPIADVFTGALILTSIYLFIKALKGSKTALFFSSLSYALAVGVKTTAIIIFPSVFIIFLLLLNFYPVNKIKYLKRFSCFFIINFIVFSSYNYILNYLQFSNFFSSNELFLIHQFQDGFKGYITNIIKYFFVIFDMSGMPVNFGEIIEQIQAYILHLIGSDVKTGTTEYFPCCFEFNGEISLMNSALGFMGLFVFLPSLIYSIKRFIKNKRTKSSLFFAVLSFLMIFNILLFARVMVFAGYNMRYILTFVIISSPVIAYSYPIKRKNIYKKFLCLIMFLYFIGYAHYKPVSYILTCIKEQKLLKVQMTDEEIKVYEYFKEKKPVNIGLMASWEKSPLFFIQQLSLNGFHIDKIQPENIEDLNLNNFDYIITNKEKMSSTLFYNFDERMKNPHKFVAKCLYNDSRQNTIYNLRTNNKPAVAECEIPFAYLREKGYIVDNNYNGNKYIILFNTKREK